MSSLEQEDKLSGYCKQCGDELPCGEHREASQESVEEQEAESSISYDKCEASLGKGESWKSLSSKEDLKTPLEENIIVTDTGNYSVEEFLGSDLLEKEDLTEDDIDEVYESSIEDGVIDHHAIDQFLSSKGSPVEKCSARMVVDYQDKVLELLEENDIKQIATHHDSDLDAVTSSYFVKSLQENGQLPEIADKVAEIANSVDYGRLHLESDEYINSLSGTFKLIKSICNEEASKEIDQEGFSPSILSKWENKGNEAIFELLNRLNEKYKENSEDLDGEIEDIEDIVRRVLPDESETEIEEVKEEMKQSFEQFEDDFADAEKRTVTMGEKEVDVIVADSDEPLTFTNLAYTRTGPETIVAVYAGEERKGGDKYDIGIQPDQAGEIDLRELSLFLNKAEKENRSQLSEEERKEIGFEDMEDRKPFEGYEEVAEKLADEVGVEPDEFKLKKDPTPIVANGSLVPASRHSLLTKEEFNEVVEDFIKLHQQD